MDCRAEQNALVMKKRGRELFVKVSGCENIHQEVFAPTVSKWVQMRLQVVSLSYRSGSRLNINCIYQS